MTNAELQALLKKYPDDMRVIRWDCDIGSDYVQKVYVDETKNHLGCKGDNIINERVIVIE